MMIGTITFFNSQETRLLAVIFITGAAFLLQCFAAPQTNKPLHGVQSSFDDNCVFPLSGTCTERCLT